MAAISTLRNMGPAMEQAFHNVGVKTAEELRALGADAAYAKLLAGGARPHFIPYYVLHMSLQGRPWNDCKGKEKDALRKSFDALVASAAETMPTGIEAVLNEIGTGLKRG